MITIILSRQINSDNINAFGLAFHSLICCYKASNFIAFSSESIKGPRIWFCFLKQNFFSQDYYTQLVEELIASQTDPEIAERLSKAFTELTSRLRLCYDRQEKVAFENNFEKFVFNIQGFLFIK